MADYIPPVTFYFTVKLISPSGNALDSENDVAFQEISGISMKMETEQVNEAGENRFAHKVPGRIKYDDLVLKRGLLIPKSAFFLWCKETIASDLANKIVPKSIKIDLINPGAPNLQSENKASVKSWVFHNAYPVKWEISAINAQSDKIVVDSVTLSYDHFQITDGA